MKAFILFGIIFGASYGFAFPEAPFNALEVEIAQDPQVQQNYDFEGIVKLSNCSGSVIRFSGQPDSSKALVLTNGHCVKSWGFLQPGEVWYNKSINRSMRVFDSNMNTHRVTARKVLFAVMTDTDAAIYELNETYSDLKQVGIEAFMMSPNIPPLSLNIEIVSGYWERGYSCYIDGFVHELRESKWTFYNSVRYSESGCEVIGGTSGSPIIEHGTRTVVAINNTGNESGQRCTMNNPCEVSKDGQITVREGRGYGQQTVNFYNCLSVDFKIDLSLRACNLPKP